MRQLLIVCLFTTLFSLTSCKLYKELVGTTHQVREAVKQHDQQSAENHKWVVKILAGIAGLVVASGWFTKKSVKDLLWKEKKGKYEKTKPHRCTGHLDSGEE